ncbi:MULTISPECIES: LPS assembly protein LptD [unclassified Minwuia]|jgi:LPS-assembly protein|uniref:LPS-assembly protein LptD n=1 Tax=unclassified Minwuia TaxID=2618799 RepID=UPI00247B24BE|nr:MULTISPECIES: LPS assembly protein LptD [unclassified Minwuia]
MRARRAEIAGLLALLLLTIALLIPGAVHAQSDDPALPTELEADEMIYERDLGIVTARGNVEITQGERILFADVVTYNERDDIVTATGNVMLREPSGDVAFAEYVELSDGFKQGIIREIRVQRADRSRLSARVARREGEDRTVLERAVFTRCESCAEHPDRPPIWQIKSGKVTRDVATEIVEYEDAMFEMFGVPVFYTPYFYHPDPTIDRKSGILTPIIGSSTELGGQLTLPLYVVLDDTSDLTFSPRITTKEGAVFGGEYRKRFDNGTFDTTGSITYVDEVDIGNRKTGAEEFRGHIQSAGRFDVGRGFESGFDLNRASDDTYLQRYDISSADVLTSDLYLRGIRGRHAASVEFFAFQSLRQNDKDGDTPFVLPLASYSTSTEPSVGGRLDGTLSAVALQRTSGRDTRRLSLEGDWAADHIGQFGDLMTFGLHLRGDGYMISEAQSTDITAVNDDEVTGRIWPMASLMWRLPMVKQEGRLMQTVEPVVQVIASPGGGNPDAIPNEDSQSFEFSEANLFERNRFVGFDRIESGSRVNYGLRLGLHGEGGGRTDLIIGQSIRLNQTSSANVGTGLEDRFSDFVGRLSIAPSDLVNYSLRFRFDADGPTVERHEHQIEAGDERYRLKLGYVSQAAIGGGVAIGNVEELNMEASAAVADSWKMFGAYRHDLTRSGGSLRAEIGLQYLDECFDFQIGAVRDFTSDRDIEASTSVFVRVQLLGLN